MARNRFFVRISFVIDDRFNDDEPQNGQERKMNDAVFRNDEAVREGAGAEDGDDDRGNGAGQRRSTDPMPQLDELAGLRIVEIVIPHYDENAENRYSESYQTLGAR